MSRHTYPTRIKLGTALLQWLVILPLSFIHLLAFETFAATEIGVAAALAKLVVYGMWVFTGLRIFKDYTKPSKAAVIQDLDAITFRWQTGGVELWMLVVFTGLALLPELGMIPVLLDVDQTRFPEFGWPYYAHLVFIHATFTVTLIGVIALGWHGTGTFELRLSHTQCYVAQTYGLGLKEKAIRFAVADTHASLRGTSLSLRDATQSWTFIVVPEPDRAMIKKTFTIIEEHKSLDRKTTIPLALQQLREGPIHSESDAP